MSSTGTARQRVRRLRTRIDTARKYHDGPALWTLAVLGVAIAGIGIVLPTVVPLVAMLIPMFLASLSLGPRTLPWFTIFCLLLVCVMVPSHAPENLRSVMDLVVIFMIGLLIMITSFRRSRLGIAGPRGESMLVELRDRIVRQGRIPPLPDEWYVDSLLRSAEGTEFAGDFIVATVREQSSLDIAVVDVSGKGVEAGTRSLMLSGAFGSLLHALYPQEFLEAANEFLVQQDWAEGFATGIHLHLELGSGKFEIRKAGHPPAVWLHAGSGRWTVLESDGSALGLMAGETFEVRSGVIEPGDAILLYTDGLVENPGRDIHSGIDKLTGEASLLFQQGFTDGAGKVLDSLGGSKDDRALVVIHRR